MAFRSLPASLRDSVPPVPRSLAQRSGTPATLYYSQREGAYPRTDKRNKPHLGPLVRESLLAPTATGILSRIEPGGHGEIARRQAGDEFSTETETRPIKSRLIPSKKQSCDPVPPTRPPALRP